MAIWDPLARTANAARRIAALLVVLALALQAPLHGVAHAGHHAGMPVHSGATVPAGPALAIPGTDFVLPWCAPGAAGDHVAEAEPVEAPASPKPAKADPCIAHCLAALTAAPASPPAAIMPDRVAVRSAAFLPATAAPAARPVVGEGAGPRAPPL